MKKTLLLLVLLAAPLLAQGPRYNTAVVQRTNGVMETYLDGSHTSGLSAMRVSEVGGNNKWSHGVLGDSFTTTELQNAFYVYQYRDKAETVLNTYRLVINDDGEVGIGTSDPEVKLHVVDTAAQIRIDDANSQAILRLQNDTATPAADTVAGQVTFGGLDDAGSDAVYARLRGLITDDASASKDGYITLAVQLGNALTEQVRIEDDDLRVVGASATLDLNPHDAPPTCNSTTEGSIYYDASLNEHCGCNGATPSWNQLDGGGSC